MTNSQQTYFDQPNHRLPETELLHLSPDHLLELQSLEMALDLQPGSRLIDFGCGNGRATLYFLKRGYHVFGIDLSPASLAALTKIYHHHRQTSWGTLTTATSLPSSSQADGMIGTDILHHINLPQYLPLFKQSLKDNGHVAFSEPNAWHLPWYLYLLKERVPWSIEQNILYINFPYLNRAFRDAGFSSVIIKGHGLFPTPLSGVLARFACPPTLINRITNLNLALGRAFTPFAFRLLISAQI